MYIFTKNRQDMLYDLLDRQKLSETRRLYLQTYEENRLRRKPLIHSHEYRQKMKEREAARRPVARNRWEILLDEYKLLAFSLKLNHDVQQEKRHSL